MSKIAVITAIIGEYIATGANNKYTIVNAYAGDVVLSTLPATIPLGLYALIELSNKKLMNLAINISYDGEVMAKAEAVLDSGEDAGLLVIPLIMLTLKKDGVLHITASAEGFEETTIIQTKMYASATPSPTA